MSGESRTEKPTPRRRDKARQEGQVARSVEVNSAVVLLTLAVALGAAGPGVLEHLEQTVRVGLERAAHPEQVDGGLGGLVVWSLRSIAVTAAPLAFVAAVAGLAASVLQVRPRLSGAGLRPKFTRINPWSGVKRIFGVNGAIETAKATAKAGVVGLAAYLAIAPRLRDPTALAALSPGGLLQLVGGTVNSLLLHVGAAFVLLAAADYAWQRHRNEKALKMTKEEVRQESRNSDVSPEIRRALRRRQYEQARRRMMADVPTADVVVVNPTHYACALRYDGSTPAPELVAKGADLVAAAIRELAREHGVPIVSDPPLARTLYAQVEVGGVVPEQLYVAVAHVLAFVFRTAHAKRRALAAD